MWVLQLEQRNVGLLLTAGFRLQKDYIAAGVELSRKEQELKAIEDGLTEETLAAFKAYADSTGGEKYRPRDRKG